jgi:hypothetical protein
MESRRVDEVDLDTLPLGEGFAACSSAEINDVLPL